MPGDFFDHVMDEAVQHFADRLQPRRDDRPAAGSKNKQGDHAQDGDAHPEGGVCGGIPVNRVAAEQGLHDELLHRMDVQLAGFFARH